jgi:hypothetical protein
MQDSAKTDHAGQETVPGLECHARIEGGGSGIRVDAGMASMKSAAVQRFLAPNDDVRKPPDKPFLMDDGQSTVEPRSPGRKANAPR